MSAKGVRVSAPLGMDAALEGLARAVLKLRPDPDHIYAFAADHFEDLLRKRRQLLPTAGAGAGTAHNAGISPSSTQESNSKQPGSEDGASTRPNEERSVAEEPESNDTSHGVEATAVRTLAATTGTVAILGTTAKTAGADTIHEDQEAERDDKEIADLAAGAGAAEPSPPPTDERIAPSEPLVQAKSPVSDSNKSEISSPEVKLPVLPVVESPTKIAEEISEVVSESKDKDEDISSERLKTNSISNTTLSSDSIVEIENNSVKQSPSADKVIESFDSSSTVEFVDSAVKDLSKHVKSNPARSISSELSNKVLPVDGEKTPDVLSPVDAHNVVENEVLPPPPPPEALTETVYDENPSTNEKQDVSVLNEPSGIKTEEYNSSSKEPLNDEGSIHSQISSNVSSSVQSVIKVDTGNQDVSSRGAIEHSPNTSDDNHKAETGSPFSSDNNSSFNGNGDIPSPVTAVVVSPVESKKEAEQAKVNSASPGKEVTVLTNGISSKTETPNITPANSPTDISKSNNTKVNGDIETNLDNSLESKVNGGKGLEMPDISDEKVIAAATTIQASYRGFQERRNLKLEKNEELGESVNLTNGSEKPTENMKEPIDRPVDESSSVLDDDSKKMTTAATTIQANFRGFQTRQNMKNKTDSGLPPTEETNLSEEMITPTALTPELIESVKEEVEEICKEAESIVAERSESADWVKGVQQVVVGCKLPSASVSESIQAMRGSTTPPEVSEADDPREEVFEADDMAVQAATTIQASFRGFQARKTLQGNQDRRDSMPNYPPPPADEEMPSLDDLPPPDFDALESSYSEDVPTEPLAPPPDSLVFNEEDEDELMSLQQLQRPQECDELPERRPTLTDSSDSSLSSAATKIQAGVRGYLTRKQIQGQGQGETGTTSTSTGVIDSVSDRSQSLEEATRSLEQESEVCRHRASPEPPPSAHGLRAVGKRMSLAEPTPTRARPPLRTALSVQGGGPAASDEDVWSTLKHEMSDAAILIQSNFRGYRARKQLQREDAVQVTSGSSQTPSSGSADAGRGSAASGEDKPGSRQEDEPGSKQEDKPGSKQEERPGSKEDKPGSEHDGKPGSRQEDKPGSKQEDKPSSRQENKPDSKEEDKSGSKQEERHGSKEDKPGSKQEDKPGSRQEDNPDSKQDGEATARCSGEYHDMIALSPPGTTNKEGGGAQAHGGGAVAGPPHDDTDAMVKRRADDPEATAATKIQATFRGFKARQGMREEDRAAAKIQAGFRGYKVRKEMKSERARQGGGGQPASGASTGAGDEETTARAATKIQAGVRGFLVRRRNRKDQPKPDDQ